MSFLDHFFNTLISFAFAYGLYSFLQMVNNTDLFKFISEHNPTIIDFSGSVSEDEDEDEAVTQVVKNIKFEDKYLEKFKTFPNEYQFTNEEVELEIQEYERIKSIYEQNRLNGIHDISSKLAKIDTIYSETDTNNKSSISDHCKNLLLEYFEKNNADETDFEHLLSLLLTEKYIFLNDLRLLEATTFNEDEMRLFARQYIINKKLDQGINNYVLELTPLGNIYMRYNNHKKSFEYFSNNTIPYRYLEPVARKYVMTYWCKPIFIDIDEELKAAEIRYDEDLKKKEEEAKRHDDTSKQNKIFARLKNYNKDNNSKNQPNMQMKNRNQPSLPLPPQIKANLPNVNQTSGKQLLKENANRYTWEGRLANFSLLKKVDKKIVDKNLSLSFSDFKRMQQSSAK
jgi:hypothetical protein